jgi:hypothetical protein
MSTYDKIWWLPICGGLTGLGLVLSYLAARRRGLGSGLRGAAWSLLPIAAYLTGSIEMFWKIGVAIGDFAKGFVFSPKVWSGIALAGLAVVLFVASGPLRRRRQVRSGAAGGAVASRGASRGASAGSGAGARAVGGSSSTVPSTALTPVAGPGSTLPATSPTQALPQPAKAAKGTAKGGKNAPDDSGIGGDVEDILRRHGIS